MGAESVGARGIVVGTVVDGSTFGVVDEDDARGSVKEVEDVFGVAGIWLVAGFWGVLGDLIVFFCG